MAIRSISIVAPEALTLQNRPDMLRETFNSLLKFKGPEAAFILRRFNRLSSVRADSRAGEILRGKFPEIKNKIGAAGNLHSAMAGFGIRSFFVRVKGNWFNREHLVLLADEQKLVLFKSEPPMPQVEKQLAPAKRSPVGRTRLIIEQSQRGGPQDFLDEVCQYLYQVDIGLPEAAVLAGLIDNLVAADEYAVALRVFKAAKEFPQEDLPSSSKILAELEISSAVKILVEMNVQERINVLLNLPVKSALEILLSDSAMVFGNEVKETIAAFFKAGGGAKVEGFLRFFQLLDDFGYSLPVNQQESIAREIHTLINFEKIDFDSAKELLLASARMREKFYFILGRFYPLMLRDILNQLEKSESDRIQVVVQILAKLPTEEVWSAAEEISRVLGAGIVKLHIHPHYLRKAFESHFDAQGIEPTREDRKLLKRLKGDKAAIETRFYLAGFRQIING